MAPRGTVLITGDVGSTSAFHVGDEAMLAGIVRALPEVPWTVVSADPAATAAQLGVPTIGGLGLIALADDEDARTRRLHALLDGVVPAGDPATPLLEALTTAAGLVIAGGGNLNTRWPEHVADRAALMLLAQDLGVPVVVTGQTLGPLDGCAHLSELARALRGCALVGVREHGSAHVAMDLGVDDRRIAIALDDAIDLAPALGHGDGDIVVTLCPGHSRDEAARVRALARELVAVAGITARPVRLVPHVGDLAGGAASADVALTDAVLAETRRLAGEVDIASIGLQEPDAVIERTRGAAMVISSRYHPLVFATGAAVPSLALPMDRYTRTKLHGALAFAGLEAWSVPLVDAGEPLISRAARELWDRRDEVRTHLTGLLPGWRTAREEHLGAIRAALAADQPRPVRQPDGPPGPQPQGDWRIGADVVAATTELAETVVAEHREAFRQAERYALSLRAALDVAEEELHHHRVAAMQPRPSRWRRTPATTPVPPATARAPADELVLHTPKIEQRGADAVSSVAIRLRGDELGRLELRRHGADPDDIDQALTPFVPIAAAMATAARVDLVLDGPVDAQAHTGAEQASAVIAGWFGWRPTRITATAVDPPRRPAEATGLCFSRGLDSSASFLRRRAELDLLVSMDWRDPPFASAGTQDIWRGTQRVALELGVPLIGVSSDARTFLDPVLPWDASHDAVLASFGLLLRPSLGTLVMANAHPLERAAPGGVHVDTDPLFSSSAVRIEIDAFDGGRNEKAALVGAHPELARHLKVCFEIDGDRNCGRCNKCTMTQANFYVAGMLDVVAERFDHPLTPESVWEVARSASSGNVIDREMILERLAPEDPLREPWIALLERVRRTDPIGRLTTAGRAR